MSLCTAGVAYHDLSLCTAGVAWCECHDLSLCIAGVAWCEYHDLSLCIAGVAWCEYLNMLNLDNELQGLLWAIPCLRLYWGDYRCVHVCTELLHFLFTISQVTNLLSGSVKVWG